MNGEEIIKDIGDIVTILQAIDWVRRAYVAAEKSEYKAGVMIDLGKLTHKSYVVLEGIMKKFATIWRNKDFGFLEFSGETLEDAVRKLKEAVPLFQQLGKMLPWDIDYPHYKRSAYDILHSTGGEKLFKDLGFMEAEGKSVKIFETVMGNDVIKFVFRKDRNSVLVVVNNAKIVLEDVNIEVKGTPPWLLKIGNAREDFEVEEVVESDGVFLRLKHIPYYKTRDFDIYSLFDASFYKPLQNVMDAKKNMEVEL